MDQGIRPVTTDDLYAGYLDRSVKELQKKVREHEEALDRVRFNHSPQSRVVLSLIFILFYFTEIHI